MCKPKKEKKIKIRQTWTRDPVQKVVPSKKVYDRKKDKKEEEEETHD